MRELIAKYIPQADAKQTEKFLRYYEMLVDWNGRVNLTAITEPEEVVTKHFADSLLPEALIAKNARCIDVGTGAGFPGIPLLIMRPDIRLTLLDSLAKRLAFLEALLPELGIKGVPLLHMRAEDAGHDDGLRQKFDVALTRAVASAPAVIEWTVPLLKVGGTSLIYKGPKAHEELAACTRAKAELRCTALIRSFPAPWGERLVIEATKTAPTPGRYPRKAGTAAKAPL